MKPVALTEWNIFAVHSRQMCSYIDGMHAALTLGEIIKDNYGLATRWHIANGSHTEGDDHGMLSRSAHSEEPYLPDWTPHPVFFYSYYFPKFFGDKMVSAVCNEPNIISYASTFSSGQIGLVLINTGNEDETIKIKTQNFKPGAKYYWYSLTGGTDNGEFSQQVFINGVGPSLPVGGPDNYENIKAYSGNASNLQIPCPRKSVEYVLIDSNAN